MIKKVAVYGDYVTRAPVYQRYWKRRRDGVKQRYWKRTRQTQRKIVSGRYEFSGKGRELYKAIFFAHRHPPKQRFVDVSAKKFLEKPSKYGTEGRWIEREVQSR